MRHADILVIGGGPAGATVAFSLARAGRQVTLLDAAAGPRDKVCGECLSALGMATLRQIGLGDALRKLRPVELRRSLVFSTAGRRAELRLPRPMWGLTRRAMDAALLRAAEAAGATVRRGVRATRVVPGERPTVHFAGGEAVDCGLVLLADGKGTLPGTAADPPRPSGQMGLKTHLIGVDLPDDAVSLFGLQGHYVGLAPVRDDGGAIRWNLAMSVPAAKLKDARGDFDGLLQRLRGENAALEVALSEASRIGDWLTCPLPSFHPRPAAAWRQNVLPIGNAAAALNPVGGEGMGLAIASAAAAARAVLDGVEPRELRRQYARLWRRRRAACGAGAMLLSRPQVGELAVRAANVPAAGRAGLWLAGKNEAPPFAGPAFAVG